MPVQPTGAEEQVRRAVRAYQSATGDLRVLLSGIEDGLETFLQLVLAEGASVAGTLLEAEASDRNKRFAVVLTEFESTRRQLRVAMLRLGLERGESLAAVARGVGISRQLASRMLANEADPRP